METQEAVAVFDDRAEMEDAVREIVATGVPTKHIHISQTASADGSGPRAPERFGVVLLGAAIGAGAGLALALAWILAVSAAVPIPTSFLVVRAVVSVLSAALLGGFIGVIVRGARRRPPGRSEGAPRERPGFVVTVEPPNESVGETIKRVLAQHRGRLVTV